ncbi:hypothetical protein [Streptacidiphilus cavernicola]|uniref:Uncharacterized protein n=1 Tax=Streptacidiphilus cavernicola TaxID=3342716 RepID=A0ABV6VVZ3_9ACTN
MALPPVPAAVPAPATAPAAVPAPTPAPYYPPVPPPPAGYQPLPVDGDGGPRAPRSRKGMYLSLAVAGWLVIAAGTATAVVAVGKDGDTSTVADSAPVATASATPSAAPTTAAPLPTPTVAPSPTSTVKGTVSGGGSTHHGDLRFFLLPVPSDAVAYGNQDGDKLSVSALAKKLGNPSTSKRILNEYGCSGGATRTYRTNDGTYTVETQLMHFSGSGYASDWVTGLSFGKGKSFSIPSVSGARGIAFDPSDPEGDGELLGVAHVGDVEYEITVDGTGKLPHSVLSALMQREKKHLTTGH